MLEQVYKRKYSDIQSQIDFILQLLNTLQRDIQVTRKPLANSLLATVVSS